ncbi:major facilitator superfamily domain-containing protein [Annulohypoxylon nitens]|nr:major facilitator superfamily domain-containing protein [Annulohypoxylon nitens]
MGSDSGPRKSKDEEIKIIIEDDDQLSPGASEYSQQEYSRIKRKADRYLLPLMWICYGIQQADKVSLSTQATFGLREDTHLIGQQYSWLTTIFYITYVIFELPSNILLQRFRMGKTLSYYMICWGFVVLSIGFTQNFTQLVTLRALQGVFECCISPGFVLVVGSWYTTREHASRTLVFQSANAGFGIISSLTLYGIGSVQYRRGPEFQAWRYMSYFLGSLTIIIGVTCIFFLGTPSEVRWLTPEEKEIAIARVLPNNTGSDNTGMKKWKWKQVKECLRDPCFWFAGINSFLACVPNGGLTAFGSIINTGFGFSNLQVILLGLPKDVLSVLWFLLVGVVTTKVRNTRMYFMMISIIPPFAGILLISLLPNDPRYKWTKWGGYFMTPIFIVAAFLAWTLIPSNVAGRTKRTITSSFTFVGYCVGNMVGSQIFKSKDAPRYIPGTIGCVVCLGLEFFLILAWRAVLSNRNKNRDKRLRELGISEDERKVRAKVLGEQDATDLENLYFRYSM